MDPPAKPIQSPIRNVSCEVRQCGGIEVDDFDASDDAAAVFVRDDNGDELRRGVIDKNAASPTKITLRPPAPITHNSLRNDFMDSLPFSVDYGLLLASNWS